MSHNTIIEIETVCQACIIFAANSGIDDLLADSFMVTYGKDAPQHNCESIDNNIQCDCTCH